MPFLVDEFTPKCYDDVFFHKEIYDRLKIMSDDNPWKQKLQRMRTNGKSS